MTVRIETLAEGVTLYCGDCLPAMQSMDANSVDACVTDPPYGLSFMGKAWDHGVPGVEYWKEVLRVLKPGAHLLAFGGTRTFGRMHVAIEDAGFEIRDMISWLYGSGFPKSLDVSKAIDRSLGAEREKVSVSADAPAYQRGIGNHRPWMDDPNHKLDGPIPATAAAAAAWSGFGTALKPACEPIVLARKPLSESTVAANVLKWGTGALNIDGCRVATNDSLGGGGEKAETAGKFTNEGWRRPWMDDPEASEAFAAKVRANVAKSESLGRWPANVIHDGSDEVVGAFPETGAGTVGIRDPNGTMGYHGGASGLPGVYSGHADNGGSAARFFYTAKADSDDRLGSKHPTVKPVDLMQYLVRLVTPPRGLVLDCFAGTGTTGEACVRERMRCILVEREEEYQDDIRRRMKLAMAGPDERRRAIAKQKHGDKPHEIGGLFA